MRRLPVIQSFLPFMLLMFVLFPVRVDAQNAFDRIIVFGDSLSDAGNKYVVTGLINVPPYDLLDPLLVPEGPYARGGLHHSNGATWIEQMARPLGFGGDVRPALGSQGRASNYAYAGARARDAVDIDNIHLSEQVATFLADERYVAPPDALYIIFIGGNDVPDAVGALVNDPSGLTSIGIMGDAVASVNESVLSLYTAGARKFLILNAPDLGLVPAMNILDQVFPGAADAATCFSALYNFGTPVPCVPTGIVIPGLADVLDALEGMPGIDILRLDIFAVLRQFVADPAAFGLSNVTDACVMPGQVPFVCGTPGEYLYWDGIHPTKAVHAIIAGKAAEVLAQ